MSECVHSSPDRIGFSMQTYTRRMFWPCDPRPEEVEIHDIAHALATVPRYAGHGLEPYSVAQHSVLVSQACAPRFALLGLLHDAAEAYVGDLHAPLKKWPALRAIYAPIEQLCHEAIMRRFGLPLEIPEDVHRADLELRATEFRDVMGGAVVASCAGNPSDNVITVWDWRTAERAFLERFDELVGASR